MAGTARVWLAGLFGFALGIAVAVFWSGATPLGTRSSDMDATRAADRDRPATPSLSVAEADGPRRPASDGKPIPEVTRSASTEAQARVQTMVYGRLLEPEGTPIRHAWWAWVSFIDRAGRRWNADAREGAYAIADLPFGSYTIAASAHAHRAAQDAVELAASQPEVKKDLQLAQAVLLRVKVVTPAGEPFFEALKKVSDPPEGAHQIVPVATKDPPGRHVYEVVGSLNNPFGVGHFWQSGPRGEDLPPGCMGLVHLDGDLPVCVSLVLCHAVLQTKKVEPGAEEVVFVISLEDVRASLGSLRVQVLDATTSAAIEGAYAELQGGPSGGGGATTDATGVARIDPALPGRFDLRIRKEHYEEVRRIVDIEPGETRDLGTVVLGNEVNVEVHVVDGLGHPTAATFLVGVLAGGDRAVDFDETYSRASDANGLLKLAGLGRKVYVLSTADHDAVNDTNSEPTWVSGNVLIDASAGSIPSMEVRLKPGVPLALRVEGEPADGLRFIVLDDQGLPLVKSRFYGPGPRPLRLPAGSYRVQLCDPDWTILAERKVALASEPVELAIGR